MVFSDVKYAIYSELGVTLLENYSGIPYVIDEQHKPFKKNYQIGCIEFTNIDPFFATNSTNLLDPSNCNDFDDLMSYLTLGGTAKQYTTYLSTPQYIIDYYEQLETQQENLNNSYDCEYDDDNGILMTENQKPVWNECHKTQKKYHIFFSVYSNLICKEYGKNELHTQYGEKAQYTINIIKNNTQHKCAPNIDIITQTSTTDTTSDTISEREIIEVLC